MTHWQNKVVLVTGASSGIGFAITKYAIEKGAKICTFSRTVTEQLGALPKADLLISQGDVSQPADVNAWIERVKQRHDKIDMMINNAGVMYYADCKAADYDQMEQMVRINCLGYVNLCQAILPILARQQTGHWVNITSDAGKQPYPGLAVYSGSKAFIEFTARAMRQELCNDNIKITNIQPGNVRTKLHQLSTDSQAQAQYGSDDEGQYLDVQDIVNAIDYAISTPHGVAVNEILVQPLTEST